MAEVSGGELQTLISTLQLGNQQLGHIYQALGGVALPFNALAQALNSLAENSLGGQIGAVVAVSEPTQFEGYITIDIPGVGPRLIPYYSRG
jgi:hypothetical protein